MAAAFGNFNGTAAAVGTTPTYIKQGDFQFIVANLSGGETITVQGATDSITFDPAFLPINTATGLPVATSALPNGTYLLPYRAYTQYEAFKFTKSAAVNNVNVAWIWTADILPNPFATFVRGPGLRSFV